MVRPALARAHRPATTATDEDEVSPRRRLPASLVLAAGHLLLAPVLSHPVVVLGRVEKVGACDGGVRIDAIADRRQACHRTRFAVRRVLEGRFEQPAPGLILHSPSTAFWGRGGAGAKFLLGLEDGRSAQGRG